MAVTDWLTKEVFSELLMATRPDVVLIPFALKDMCFKNGIGTMKGVEFEPRVKNIKFLTKYVRMSGGESTNSELNQIVSQHKIPRFAFQIVDLAPDDDVKEVKDYLFETWRVDQGPSANEFLREFTKEQRKDQERSDKVDETPREAGQEWRYMGGDPKVQALHQDLDSLFDKNGNMSPVTCKIKTKSGKEMQISVRIIDGELAAKMFDELEQKYGKDFMRKHVQILDGKDLKEVLEQELGEPIESIEFAGGELSPEQFMNAPKVDPGKLKDKMQSVVDQFKDKMKDSKDKQVEVNMFNNDDPELKELAQKLSQFN